MKEQSVPKTSPEAFARRIVSEGGHFLVGEYRGSKVSVVEYLDKESGKKESYVKVMHSIEVGAAGVETVHLQEQIDRNIKTVEEYHTWLERGMKVLVVPRSMTAEKGIKKFTCGSADMWLLDGTATPGGNDKK